MWASNRKLVHIVFHGPDLASDVHLAADAESDFDDSVRERPADAAAARGPLPYGPGAVSYRASRRSRRSPAAQGRAAGRGEPLEFQAT